MHKKLKIAVYSGRIPSTTFIENLIQTISENHTVLLFGSQPKPVSYPNKNIVIYKTPVNNWLKLAYNVFRSLQLAVSHPKALIALYQEIIRHKSHYQKWQQYSKLLPMILHQPDILHIQWAKSLDDFMILKTRYNIPIILSLRGAHINYSPIVSKTLADSYRKNFPRVDAFHAVSNAIKKEAEHYGAKSENIKTIYSILPTVFLDAYLPLKPKTDGTIKILSVGRAHWIKGYSYAIEAVSILKIQGIDIHYQIVGIDKSDEELLFLIAEHNLQNNVKLKPKISQKELIALMQTQDIMLLSSLEEGLANVILEAMALGLPVISTNCGGMSEVVIPEKTGVLAPIRDAKAMAQAIISLNQMPYQQLSAQTENAHRLIKTKFNQENNATQFLELYNSVLA